MKKVLFSAVLAIFAITSNAQIWMGGNVGFNFVNHKATETSTSTFSIQPEVGYTLNENWDAALALNFESREDDTNVFSLNPYARYTFLQSGKLGLFIDGGIEVGSEASKFAFGIAVRPGVKLAVSDRISFVAHVGSFGFRSVTDRYSTFGLNVNNSTLLFGMYWTL